jgi:hypothetical protein
MDVTAWLSCTFQSGLMLIGCAGLRLLVVVGMASDGSLGFSYLWHLVTSLSQNNDCEFTRLARGYIVSFQ